MQISRTKNPVFVGGKPKSELQCSIADMAFAMELLTKHYTRPIKAICQEISSNARDAHREIGKDDIPVQIQLPNAIDSRWICRDFGPGISPTRMADVFVKYGSSTKRNDNVQTGGFGIGAKTPWAYSSTFGIETFCPEKKWEDDDGKVHKDVMVKRTYLAYMGEDGIGRLALTVESLTDEPRGTAIIVTAKPEDFRSFKRWTCFVCSYWETRPTITGDDFTWPEFKVALDGDNWILMDSDHEFLENEARGPMAIIDHIPYPLHIYDVYGQTYGIQFIDKKHNSSFELTKQGIEQYPIRLYFQTGDLMQSTNREEINYKNSDLSLIRDRIQDCFIKLREQIYEKIDAASNLWEAWSIWNKCKALHGDLINNMTWNGLKIPIGAISLDWQMQNKGLKVRIFVNKGSAELPIIRYNTEVYLNGKEHTILAFQDELGEPVRRNKIWTILKANPGKAVAVICLYNDDSNVHDEANKYFKDTLHLNEMSPILLSTVDKTPIPSVIITTVDKNGVKTKKASKPRFTRALSVYDINCKTNLMVGAEETVSLKDDGGLYLIVYRDELYMRKDRVGLVRYRNLKEVVEGLKTKVYIIKNNDHTHLGKKWKSFEDQLPVFARKLLRRIGSHSLIAEDQNRMDHKASYLFNFIKKNRKFIEDSLDHDSLMWRYFITTINSKDNSQNPNNKKFQETKKSIVVLNTIISWIRDKDIKKELASKIKTEDYMSEVFDTAYPLIDSNFGSYYSASCSPEHFVEYCKLCDESNSN